MPFVEKLTVTALYMGLWVLTTVALLAAISNDYSNPQERVSEFVTQQTAGEARSEATPRETMVNVARTFGGDATTVTADNATADASSVFRAFKASGAMVFTVFMAWFSWIIIQAFLKPLWGG